LSNNQDNFHLYRFTNGENIAKRFRGYCFLLTLTQIKTTKQAPAFYDCKITPTLQITPSLHSDVFNHLYLCMSFYYLFFYF